MEINRYRYVRITRWVGPTVAVFVAAAVALSTARGEDLGCSADPEWSGKIDLALSNAMRESGTPGVAVGVIREGKIIYMRGHGVERKEDSPLIEVTCRTRFHAASVSKPVVATALVQSFNSGELSDNQRIDHLLGGLHIPATLASLMTHTAGMRDWLRASGRRTEDQKDSYFRKVLTRAEKSSPGKPFRYSDADYNLLTYTIERRFERDLDAVMHERVFAPLGMSDSSFNFDEAAPAQAWPHTGTSNKPSPKHPYDLAFAGSSGLQTSARDMLLFSRAYLNADPRLMPAPAYVHATRPVVETQWTGISQSLVWQVASSNGQTIWQHGGTDTGFRALVTLYPATRSAIVILANGEELDRWALRGELESLLGLT